MLYGGVNYRLKADPEKDVFVPWAGRVVFVPETEGEAVKMQVYQVYLVCRPTFSFFFGGLIGADGDEGSFGSGG